MVVEDKQSNPDSSARDSRPPCVVDPSVVALSARVATIVFGTSILASCILQFARADCQAQSSGDGTCKTCGAAIAGLNYCSECNGANHAPVNGVCADVSQSAPGNTFCTKGDSGTCSACKGASFMFKGGCYEKGQQPGSTVCQTPGSADGVCGACAAGYYKTTPELATADSCVACHGDCAACTGALETDCTRCQESSKYLKVLDAEDGSGQCVATAGECTDADTHFLVTDTKTCYPCSDTNHNGVANCQTCTKESTTLKCLTCSDPNKPNKAGTKCFDCQVTGCSHCSADGVCEACSDGKKVSPGGSSCVTACPDNSTEKETGTCLCNEGYSSKDGNCELASTGPNLSTGAIAGISVAAVVVVGGLVGFLCWWFICRGKA